MFAVCESIEEQKSVIRKSVADFFLKKANILCFFLEVARIYYDKPELLDRTLLEKLIEVVDNTEAYV